MKLQHSPWETEETVMYRDAAKRFFENEFAPKAEDWVNQGMVDREAWNQAGEYGLLCPSVPEEYGGAGGTFAHETVVAEELEYAGVAPSFGIGVHSLIIPDYILAYGTEEQKLQWLPKLVSGEAVGAIAMSEPGTGSDLQAVRTRGEKVDGGWKVSGQKTFITNGQHADLIITVVKTGDGKGSKSLSLMLIDAKSEGYRAGRNLKKIGMRGSDTSELFFDDVFVPDDQVLGETNHGFYMLMQQLVQERLGIAVGAVAAMERALALTCEYTRERKAFGQPIAEFQNTRFELAEIKTEATIARIFLDECIQRHLKKELDTPTASMAKYWCTDKQNQILDRCLQLFGGYGYMQEYPISRMYVDARVQRIYGGTNEIMKELISRTL